jgi:arylsulfatase A-like enzyme
VWLLLLNVACDAEPARPARPSVLLVSLDTVGARHMALYGGEARMPNLEALAARSVVFENAFAQATQTQPSHWVMLTGQQPEVHRDAAVRRGSRYGGKTLAERLRAEGYATGVFIGGATMSRAAAGLERGFDVYEDEGFSVARDLRPADDVVAGARRWIDEQGGPWFALVHLFDAHTPYDPEDPRRYDPDYTGAADGGWASIRSEWSRPWMTERDVAHVRSLYLSEITELDAALGTLLEDVPDDTVVIVTADHGESFRHGYFFNHAEVVYDDVLHVPLVIRAPGIAPRREGALVGLLDVTPTALALVGAPPATDARGAAVLPETKSHSYVYARSPGRAGTHQPLLSVRSRTHKAVFLEDGRRHAYDLVADPGEDRRLQTVPADLADARDAYRAEADRDAARWPDTPGTLDAGTLHMLQALGYADAGR